MEFPNLRTSRVRIWAVRLVAISAAFALLPATVGAEPSSPSQNSESLRDKAERIAAELDNLEGKASALDEDYNSAYIEVEELKAGLAETEAEVEAARKRFDTNQDQARDIAIEAFVGNDGSTSDVDVFSSADLDESSHRNVYLTVAHGDRTEVLEETTAAREDLEATEARLADKKSEMDAKLADLEEAKGALTDTIEKQEALLSDVQGDLAEAVEAERVARAEAQAAEARRQAAAAAESRSSASASVAVATPSAPSTSSSSSSTQSTPATTAPPAPAYVPPATSNPAGAKAVSVAMAQRGKPYVWAGSGPNSFDCSGLVKYAYAAAGIPLPHSSRSLRSMTQYISEAQLQPGDLVFGGNPVHHVGIYIGGGQMVHAPSSGDVVKVSGIYRVTSAVSFGRL